jgi:hypothetical protein
VSTEPVLSAAASARPRVGIADLVWIVGYGRTGSTWLSLMLASLPGAAVWLEPNIARALAIANRPENTYAHSPLYVLGGVPEHWMPAVRAFIVAAVRARFPDHRRGDMLVLKDQNSGEHVGRVLEAVPESRIIVLVRDPRDVIASIADAMRAPNAWTQEWVPPELRQFDVEESARDYAQAMGAALAACDRHPGPKIVTTYEELRADPNAAIRRIRDTLGLSASDEAIDAAVYLHAWEHIPAAEKGTGRFYRKATPGGWRDDLSAEEVAIVEQWTAPVLHRFYDGVAAPATKPAQAEAVAQGFAWPEVDVDPQLSATHVLIDQLRVALDERTALLERIHSEAEQRLAIIHQQQAAIDALRQRLESLERVK